MKWTKGKLQLIDPNTDMVVGRWSNTHLPFLFHFDIKNREWARLDGFALFTGAVSRKPDDLYWCELPNFVPEREIKTGDYIGYDFINEQTHMVKMPLARAEVITVIDGKVVMKGAYRPNWPGLLYFSEENNIKTYYFMEEIGKVRTWPAMGGKVTLRAGDPLGWGMPKGNVGPSNMS